LVNGIALQHFSESKLLLKSKGRNHLPPAHVGARGQGAQAVTDDEQERRREKINFLVALFVGLIGCVVLRSTTLYVKEMAAAMRTPPAVFEDSSGSKS
jgi:hypothetical protein